MTAEHDEKQEYRNQLLSVFADRISKLAARGLLVGTPNALQPVKLRGIYTVTGPRAGGLEIDAGVHAEKVLERLNKRDAAFLRQFIPWNFPRKPMIYMDGKYIRIDVNWHDAIADRDISIYDVGTHPRSPFRWVAGKSDSGTTVVTGFDDEKPGYLMGGSTGSGKSEALASIAAQLTGAAWGKTNQMQLVLIDGKGGEGLGRLAGLPNLAGPLATSLADAKAALQWCVKQMKSRYEDGFSRMPRTKKEAQGPVVVIVDEVQNFAKDNDEITELLRRIINEGRAAWIHPIVATQYPKVDYLGDSATRMGLVGRIGLYVSSYHMSQAIFDGSEPRADYLQAQGDSFVRTPRATKRVQWSRVRDSDLKKMVGAQPAMSAWPQHLNTADLMLQTDGQQRNWTPTELAVTITHAIDTGGRPTLKQRLEEAGINDIPGSTSAARLLQLGRDVYTEIENLGFSLTA